ncbi:hypothetical protein FLL45_07940 [Aliikangiella marina]|uniref:Uncharacterized protein n=1 Tax=Aliikangiella marina TaxID=1712262 RepID=A0A545TCE0_9GAMM|nr:hypothetical protein [Aliikangiella marina]TQV74882.1 hypothetical protein FLL45_07940 [Aliikangiella marina]
MEQPKSDDTIYQAPQSELFPDSRRLKKRSIAKKIRNGWIAAIAYATLLLILLVTNLLKESASFSLIKAVEVLFIYCLALGVYKHNRFAAAIMLAYFIGSKLFAIATSDTYTGIGLIIIFSYFFYHATIACFQYHHMKVKLEL